MNPTQKPIYEKSLNKTPLLQAPNKGHEPKHHHAPTNSKRALFFTLILNSGFLIVEASVGWWTQSLALLSDAIHMVSDVGALSIAFLAAFLAERAASTARTYGYKRAEVLGASFNTFFLWAACIYIVAEAIERIQTPPSNAPDSVWVFVIGTLGLLINLGSAWMLFKSSPDNVNIKGAMLHMAADALGSLGAMLAALFIWWGFPIADAIVSLLIAGLVIFSSMGLIRQLMQVLMEGAPSSVDVTAVKNALSQLTHVESIHDLHIWSIGGEDKVLTAHLCIPDEKNIFPVLKKAVEILEHEFQIAHITLQPESAEIVCTQTECTLSKPNLSSHHGHLHS